MSSAVGFRRRGLVSTEPGLEVADALAQPLAERRQARAAEEQDDDQEDEENMSRLQLSHALETAARARSFPQEPIWEILRFASADGLPPCPTRLAILA
jgi:hypothetical protein